jgi:hypothetical protein
MQLEAWKDFQFATCRNMRKALERKKKLSQVFSHVYWKNIKQTFHLYEIRFYRFIEVLFGKWISSKKRKSNARFLRKNNKSWFYLGKFVYCSGNKLTNWVAEVAIKNFKCHHSFLTSQVFKVLRFAMLEGSASFWSLQGPEVCNVWRFCKVLKSARSWGLQGPEVCKVLRSAML